jgi:hypothetical protein
MNGAQCRANAQTGKDFCVFHDPSKIEDGHRARRTGGINRNRRAVVLPVQTADCPLTDSAEVSTLLADSINQVRRGQLDPRVANTVGYLASVQLRALEQATIEKRVAGLEKVLGMVVYPHLVDLDEEEEVPDVED